MKNNTTIKTVLVLASVSLVVIAYFDFQSDHEILIARGKIAAGVITDYGNKKGTGAWLTYNFQVDGVSYSEQHAHINLPLDFANYLFEHRKSVPVIYDSIDPSNSDFLLMPTDFKSYELSFPDSMNWIYETGFVERK